MLSELEVTPFTTDFRANQNLCTFLLVGNQDEILSNYGIRLSRGMAWYNAIRLLDTDRRRPVEASIARAPEALARALVDPPVAGWLFRWIRCCSTVFRRWPTEEPAA